MDTPRHLAQFDHAVAPQVPPENPYVKARSWALAAGLLLPLLGFSSAAMGQSADLVLAQHVVAPDPVPAGGIANITMTVQNNGTSAASNVVLTDSIPAGSTFVSMTASDGGSCTAAPPYECAWGSLPYPSKRTVTLRVRLPSATVWTNSASIDASTPDSNAANNSLTRNITVVAAADLAITATSSVGAGPVAAGTPYTYSLAVGNSGPDPLPAGQAPVVTFNVPAGSSVRGVPTGSGWSCQPASGYPRTAPAEGAPGAQITCSRDDALAAGSSYPPISVPAVANVTGSVAATFDVRSDFPDGDTGNNTATVPVALSAGTDMSIDKTASLSAVGTATRATYTLTPRQQGGSAPTGVTVRDALPAGLAYVSHSAPAPWTCDFSATQTDALTCVHPGTYVGGPYTALPAITLVAEVTGVGDIPNTGEVTADQPDPTGSNNTSTVTVNNSADLGIAKTSDVNPVVVGAPYNWTIVVRNYGPMPVLAGQTIRVQENLPAGMVVRTPVTSAGWTCTGAYTADNAPVSYPTNGDAVTLSCLNLRTANLGFNASSGTAAPNLVVPVSNSVPGAVANSACVSLSGAGPREAGDGGGFRTNCVSTGTTGTESNDSADLQITKTASQASVVVGQPLAYTLQVTNRSTTNAATQVHVYDTVNDLLTSAGSPGLVSIIAPAGDSCTPTAPSNTGSASIDCNLHTLAAGETKTVTITVVPNNTTAAPLARTNTATVNSLDIGDPIRGNNSASVTTSILPRVDATVAKTVNPSSAVRVGQPMVYTVTARNAGPSTANELVITDVMPANTTFISVGTPSNGGVCSSVPTVGAGGTLSCRWTNVAGNSNRTVTFTVRPLAAALNTTINNVVNVAVGAADTETDTTNNSANVSATITDSLVDILVQKTDTVDPVPLGGETTYRINIRNAGPSYGTNLVLVDTFPNAGNTARFSYQGQLTASVAGATVTPACTEPAIGAMTGTLRCTFPTLAVGVANEVVLTYRMRAESIITAGDYSGTQGNKAVVSVDEVEVQLTNNEVNEDTTTSRAGPAPGDAIDLGISKTVAPGQALPGAEFDYTLTVTNHQAAGSGRDVVAANGVQVTDTLPAGLSFVSAAGCSYAAATRQLTCVIPSLAAGATTAFTLRVKVDSPYTGDAILSNTACVDMPGDPVSANNCSTVTQPAGTPPVTPVPTLSQWALIVLSLLVGALAIRRRGLIAPPARP
ncbi:IPTL-CTERM sorting domain-containing protein [Acidovorax sp. Leaf160]|uniref:IPTL-CTERM sorting domain-containing protein n=1 Tax=Acidovorax sp. Leaf160 TaxID=1736280 RepID=UPI00138F0499|nr:IPTL-CTERM sorting domain-containing protein [Acidovorax sp. Leaf160]